MRVLWITNIIFPQISSEIGIKPVNGGGWMYSAAEYLIKTDETIRLAVATIYKGKDLKVFNKDNIVWYLLPSNRHRWKYNKDLEIYWKKVVTDFKPDLTHIHGTEFPHSLAFVKVCPNEKWVVSIQGLVSVYSKYYCYGLSWKDILKSITLRDFLTGGVWAEKRVYEKRGYYELEILKRAKNVIGRTVWDLSHVKSVNSQVAYYHVDETLRSSFYGKQWVYDKCVPHSIFISQAVYPIKGFHQLLKALPIVLKKYPDCKVFVAGNNELRNNGIKNKLKISGYANYLLKLINKYNLKEHVFFMGTLDEKEMCEAYLKSNVFICPSSIENSPNSLGEAQLLGVPCVAAYVGGVPDMMLGSEKFMYRYEEYTVMADLICSVFQEKDKVKNNSHEFAMNRHDRDKIISKLIEVYNNVGELC